MEEGRRMYGLLKKIFPIYRHLTGNGVRQTLFILNAFLKKECAPLISIKEIPSGESVFDWTVPKEWRIEEGYIEDEKGNRIVDMRDNNLHIVAYSVPVDEWMELSSLKEHIYTQKDQPHVIPYVTSYYSERWGFCMSDEKKDALLEGRYHAVIKSELFDGCMTYGEAVVPGECEEEVFFSTYICHPSMANNECSGPALAAELVRFVSRLAKRRYTYRFVFIPETIGSIAYLAHKGWLSHLKGKMKCGFNLTCVGDDRSYSMVETRYADTFADKVLSNVLKYQTKGCYNRYSFLERGSDERQYCAPGVDLPVVGFSRSLFHKYPEYHTSADNLDIVCPSGLQGAFDAIKEAICGIEHNYYYKTKILCEPQLGKRGLYPTFSQKHSSDAVFDMSNFIAYSDGKNDLFDISNITGAPVSVLYGIAEILEKEGIVEKHASRCE